MRAWCQLRPAAGVLGRRTVLPAARTQCRPCLRGRALAVRAVSSRPQQAAPLSLSDIISFESEMTGTQQPPAASKDKDVADSLIDRASRVLSEARSVLELQREVELDSPPAPQAATTTAVADAPPSRLTAEELGRAIFGNSAKESERQQSRTRQALQVALEGSSGASASSAVADPDAPPSPSAKRGRDRWAGLAKEQDDASGSGNGNGSGVAFRDDVADGNGGGGAAGAGEENPERPSWAAALFAGMGGSGSGGSGSGSSMDGNPVLQAAKKLKWAPLAFAEKDASLPSVLMLKSEESLLMDKAKDSVLPPLQSVMELTKAFAPPSRGGALEAQTADEDVVAEGEVVGQGALGRKLQDGVGRLADGTRFEKLSGTDTGENGYVKKWEVLRGITGDGTVSWEECWWQASDRYGLKELGAFKKGNSADGGAWREEWKELLYTHPDNLRAAIERSAHKWARDAAGDEWEEKWGEHYEEVGRVHKWADKWAKQGPNVWHERWGEDYDGQGACQKYTDKWAERLLPDGGAEQWGDKWTETFGHGKGTKHGEVWSGSPHHRYNRYWNEEHYGDGRVRKYGNSNTGEYWDNIEHMDTYYNPIPHFGFKLAAAHSPTLWNVPLPPPSEKAGEGGSSDDDDGLGVGLGRL